MQPRCRDPQRSAFTLIELLVVISIISLLISMLMPSLSRARDQAKSVHCLARLKEFGNSLASYMNTSQSILPPARWYPSDTDIHGNTGDTSTPQTEDLIAYGWTEILFEYVYQEEVRIDQPYPVQRNVDGRRWQKYFICQGAGDESINSGHYRVYLPSWSAGSYGLGTGGVYTETTRADPDQSSTIERIRLKLPIIGDANDRSERGDGLGTDESSYIDAGEANYAGSDGRSNGNRFSDRHYGGTNYLFPDLHGSWDPRLREELARDYDLNGVIDIPTEP